MYLDFTVAIPSVPGKIYIKNLKGTDYVNYEYGREYKPEKHYNVPKRTTIGKVYLQDRSRMYPNANFLRFFPDAELSETEEDNPRSSCLQIGNYLVLGKLIEESRVRMILLEQFSASDTGLILDLACYAIVTENNAGQYYPDYAYHHPLLTEDMKVYTDTKVSDFLKSITTEQRIGFLNAWN